MKCLSEFLLVQKLESLAKFVFSKLEMSTENNHDHSHSGSQICFNLLLQWDKMTFNLLPGCWRAPFKELRLYQNVCTFVCVRVCVTHRSRSSPLRILVGSSSCSLFPAGCIFLRADTGLSRRAPPRLGETDRWEVEEGLGSEIRELISHSV